MAITKNLIVTLKDDIVELKDKMFIFRNDVGVEMIIELKDFEYSIDAIGNTNNFSKVNAIFRTPSGKLYSYNNIKVLSGKIRFVFTQDLIDVMQEIGEYELQFQLYDKLNNRLTIPSYNFYVKEPLCLPNEAIVGEGTVGFSYVAEDETYLFSIENGYIKTEWETGDLITKEKLNKMESAIFDAVNAINNMDTTNNPNLGHQHTHNNMGILNTITADKINQWDNMSNGNNVSSLLIDLKSLGVMEGNNAKIIENNTAILQSLIEQYPKGQMTFYLSKGTYYFNPIDLTNISGSIIIRLKGENNGMSTSWFKGIFTTIKTNMQDFIYDRRSDSPGITFYVDDIEFYSFDGYKNIPTGVCFGAEVNGGKEYNFHFYNVLIHGFDYGFKSPGYSCAGSGGKNITLSTCHYGIYIKSTSHLFQADCVNLTYNRVGIRFGYGGSPCSISNIHVANGYLGSDKDDFDRFIVIHTKGGTHISNIYQEAYEGNAQPEKTTIIDYEGWAYGTGAVIVENTPIAIPSGNGGLFFKGRTFLGAGTEEGVDNPIELYSGNLDYYPNGCVKFINCKIANNVDISSIFDVPAQSPGYDINNKLFYKDSKIINKNNIGKVNSKLTYNLYNITSVAEGEKTYNIYDNLNFDEPYNGFKVSELRAFKNFYSKTNIKLKGNIIIEDTLSDTLDASIGFMHRYYIDNVANYKFYPVTTLKASQGVSSFPFDFIIERVTGEDYRTQINICTMFKNETNKLKATDFDKIRFKFDIEVYRD